MFFINILIHCTCINSAHGIGFIADSYMLLAKYNLRYVLDVFINIGDFPSKLKWRNKLKSNLQYKYMSDMQARLNTDQTLTMFKSIHTDGNLHTLWDLGIQYPII